jgi:hypothetical protein
MIPQYDHKLLTSFNLWLDNRILTTGQAFTNVSNHPLIYNPDLELPSQTVFSSAYKQWVFDSSVPNATVRNYVSGQGFDPLDRALHGDMKIDYNNGRLMFDSSNGSVTSSDSFAASFAVKDFNIYTTSDTEQDLIINNHYEPNPRYSSITSSTPIKPYAPVTPAIFLAIEDSNNIPLALGGMNETIVHIRAAVFAENIDLLYGALSIMRDTKDAAIAMLDFPDWPTDEYGDLKTGAQPYNLTDGDGNPYFNYTGLAATKTDKAFVDDVDTTVFEERSQDPKNPSRYIGIADFEVVNHRNPRI